MRLAINSFISIASIICLTACGGQKSLNMSGMGPVPKWFSTPPQDPDYLVAARTATARDLGLAIEKAVTNARAEIARQAQVKVEGLQKSFQEEVGADEDAELLQMFSQVNKTVVSISLSGSRVRQQTHVKEANRFRAYVLMEYPIGAANQAFMEALKASQQMYTRFRASQAFKELNEETRRFEEWKKEQAANN